MSWPIQCKCGAVWGKGPDCVVSATEMIVHWGKCRKMTFVNSRVLTKDDIAGYRAELIEELLPYTGFGATYTEPQDVPSKAIPWTTLWDKAV